MSENGDNVPNPPSSDEEGGSESEQQSDNEQVEEVETCTLQDFQDRLVESRRIYEQLRSDHRILQSKFDLNGA